MIVNGKRISIGKAKLEARIAAVIKAWAVARPAELAAFAEQQKVLRAQLHQQNGISRRGDLRHVAEIPASLVYWLRRHVDRDWWEDPFTRELVYKNFQVGIVGRGERSKQWVK